MRLLISSITCLMLIINAEIIINVNDKQSGMKFKHFWRSTGLCPPDPKTKIHKFLLSEDEKINLALIGGLPHKAIEQVRIHWLLNLIHISLHNNTILKYNFTHLDMLLDWMHDQKLYPGFEIMGTTPLFYHQNELQQKFDFFLDKKSVFYDFWYNIVFAIARRYIDRYGFEYVQKWRFETWNEPDLKSYNVLNFTLDEYFLYVSACADALKDVREVENKRRRLKLGGPAGLFKDPKKHPLCWGLLRKCNDEECPLQFVSFHKKGDGTSEQLLNRSLELLESIHSAFPNIRRLPIANDEADISTGWSKSLEWRGDVGYAAMVVDVIIGYFKKLVLEKGVQLEVLSNDNAFMNYHPYYFTQRTLLTRFQFCPISYQSGYIKPYLKCPKLSQPLFNLKRRKFCFYRVNLRFQMNMTQPPHVQFIKKPVYSVMGLLSLLGDEYLEAESSSSTIEYLVTRENKTLTMSLLITYINNNNYTQDGKIPFIIVMHGLETRLDTKYVVYVLDNLMTNPFLLWRRNGSPSFPTRELRKEMRKVEEPLRLHGPIAVVNSVLRLKINLTSPTVALVHVCSKSLQPPGRVTHLKAFNVTRNEVLLIWKDNKVCSKCILTYEVEFQRAKMDENVTKPSIFRRVNLQDTIFLSYHHVDTGESTHEATCGTYRVRAVDYWNTPGQYSKLLRYPSH